MGVFNYKALSKDGRKLEGSLEAADRRAALAAVEKLGHVPISVAEAKAKPAVAESMPAEVELRVGAVPGVGDAEVNLVWDPPWSPQNMSDEARLELGML